tara:strand:- start:747 stop:1142 length:396 start_codon:yes stop_codon:yes gene_type:complete
MGRSANAYTFIAVEFSYEEAKDYLNKKYKKIDESSWGDEDENFFGLISDYATAYDIRGNKPGLFSSYDYDEEEIYNIYFGYKVLDGWLNAYADSITVAESTSFSKASGLSEKLEKRFPEKKAKIVTLLDIG